MKSRAVNQSQEKAGRTNFMQTRFIRHQKVGFATVLALLALLCAAATAVRAQTAGNTIAFTETSRDKVKCVKDPGNGPTCDMTSKNVFKITATMLMGGVDITLFDQDTSFDLAVGDFSVSNVLGEDPAYTTNKTSATFVNTDQDGNGRTVVTSVVQLKWDAQMMSVSIKGATTDFLESVMAGSLDGESTGKIQDATTADIDLGDASFSFDSVFFTGKINTHDVAGRDKGGYTLSNIRLKGSGTQ